MAFANLDLSGVALARRDHAGGRLVGDIQNPHDLRAVAQGAVGERPPGVFVVAIARHDQVQVDETHGLACEYTRDQRADIAPDLRPHVGNGRADRRRWRLARNGT